MSEIWSADKIAQFLLTNKTEHIPSTAFITPSFTWSEVLIHQVETPSLAILNNLVKVTKILQVYRDKVFKMPVTVTSGWRSVAYNASIGGATKSLHTLGMALDFTVKNWTIPMVFDVMDRIHYGGVERTGGEWQHIDIRMQNVRFTPNGVILSPHYSVEEHDKIFK